MREPSLYEELKSRMKKQSNILLFITLFAVEIAICTDRWLAPAQAIAATSGYALRFFGNGINDIDRVKIQIDDPATANPGPPADVGTTDFTLEFWMKASASENTASAVQCGSNINWIYGNIIFDRDRFNQDRKFGLSIAGGLLVFGVSGDGTGDRTICGVTDILDSQWRHVAIQRRRSDGQMWLFVDGFLEAQANGPDGDISYPDDGVPGNFCGGNGKQPCTNSDPYLVIGAEKHDAGPQFPSYSGWVDEVRLSNVLRYSGNFTPPILPFSPDGDTVALYHFDEGQDNVIDDSSGAIGGPSNGVRRLGGSPAGPLWVTDTPFDLPPDTTPPTAAIVSPHTNSTVSGTIIVTADASDESGVAGVQFLLNGMDLGSEDATEPYSIAWNTLGVANGSYTLRARARDMAGNQGESEDVTVIVFNPQPLPSDLIAAYSFDEGSGTTVADASGNGNTGVLINGPVWDIGKIGGALRFDGIDDKVSIPNANFDGTGEITLVAWIKAESTGGRYHLQRIMENTYLMFEVDRRRRRLLFTSRKGNKQFTGRESLALDVWQHVAVTRDVTGQFISFYINGVKTERVTKRLPLGNNNFAIGGSVKNKAKSFRGWIDEVQIYERMLSDAEIQTLYLHSAQ